MPFRPIHQHGTEQRKPTSFLWFIRLLILLNPLKRLPPGDSVFHYGVNCPKCIFETDFLSFFISASGVGDSRFVNSNVWHAGNLGRYFWFDAEPVFAKNDLIKHVFSKHFVPCFHIGQVQVGEHVGEKGEKTIGHSMPKIKHPCLVIGAKS